ncbi:MAG: hypothetical protein ACQCXQ_14440 [Verrucomicrobiales bacterium]|nr:hypothetical protein [Verrucomicrobiota bacterium JB025]
MKAILYVVSLLVIAGAAYYTLELNRKFDQVQQIRLETIEKNQTVSANADAKEKELKDEQKALAAAEKANAVVTQSIAALKSKGSTLQREVSELDNVIRGQEEEFAELEKAMAEVNKILEGLGGGVTLETLPDLIQEIEEKRDNLEISLDEKTTLGEGARKQLAKNRSDLDRLVKRMVSRNARIAKNSMESVVTAVDQDWGFLVIGAGSNSGFAPQAPLIVKRDGRAIGIVKPTSIEPTQTIADIDFDSLGSGVRLQPGDRVILSKPLQ